ncbi:MAG: HEAT repeat domain-containing protein [Treponema sp.]|nr:HEAT repeat domain-containing protein [Treponema sp.]
MFSLKRFSILILMGVIVLTAAAAQSSTGRGMTVEESYLMEYMEIMIIRETARLDSRDQKLRALDYIGEAIGRGNTNDEIRETLAYLSGEGRRSVARENNRVVNNFPDVRRQAARYLGIIGTEEARQSLIEIIQFENEPMVLQEAIKSLGDIGTNENNETVRYIAWVMDRYTNLNPDNLMALAAIDAFEKIASNNSGAISQEAITCLVRISEGNYLTPVKERARQLLADFRNYR